MIGVIKGTMRQKKEVTGLPLPIASYKANMKAPIRSLKVAITAVQSGSGDPTPDNIRPIIGASECNVVRTGTNVWDEEWENGTFNTTTGANINNTTVNVQIRSKNFIPILPNVQYRFIGPNYTGWFIFFDIDGNVINNPNVTRSSGKTVSGNSVAINNGVIFTVNEPNVRYTRFYMTSAYPSTYNHDIAINYPATDTNYHAYTGNTYTIQLGDTYYGCYINATTGLLTVKWISADLKNLSYTKTTSGLFLTTSLMSVIKKAESGSIASTHIRSSHFSAINSQSITGPQGSTPSPNGVMAENTSGHLYFNYTDVTSIDDFKDAMQGVNFIYELATPQTIQLTPTQIEQLLGANNVWADTGDVTELKYFNRQVYYGN